MDENISKKLIAEKAGVSKRTVTRVLYQNGSVSEKTKEKVMRVIEEVGYTQNKLAISLSKNQNNNFVAMFVPDMTNYYYLEMFDNIMTLLNEREYTVSLYRITKQNFCQVLEHVIQYRVAAIINLTFMAIPANYLKKLRGAKIKVIHPNITDDPVKIEIDYSDAIKEAFENLWNKGRRNFRFLCGAEREFIVDKRIQRYLSLLSEHGVGQAEETVIWGDYPEVSALQAGYTGIKQLGDSAHKIDAVFALNDMMAMGAMKAFSEAGMEIGKDVLVVGFDNILIGEYLQTPLSTIDSNIALETKKYVSYIFDENIDESPIKSKFIGRESSGK